MLKIGRRTLEGRRQFLVQHRIGFFRQIRHARRRDRPFGHHCEQVVADVVDLQMREEFEDGFDVLLFFRWRCCNGCIAGVIMNPKMSTHRMRALPSETSCLIVPRSERQAKPRSAASKNAFQFMFKFVKFRNEGWEQSPIQSITPGRMNQVKMGSKNEIDCHCVIRGTWWRLFAPSQAYAEDCPRGSWTSILTGTTTLSRTCRSTKARVNPSTIIFYTPVEDPAVYAKVWDGFEGESDGQEGRLLPGPILRRANEAMRSGRLHVAGVNTGSNPVRLLAPVSYFAMMASKDGEMEIIVPADSKMKSPSDIKGGN